MSDQRVGKLLQEMAGNDAVAVSPPLASVKKGAALAYVAEQFGFTYVSAKQHGHRNSQLTVLLVRDPRPEAAQRAAGNHHRFPHAATGGPAPGLQHGGLKPLPEAQAAFDLLQARITFDITGKSAEKRILLGMVAVAVGCLLGAVVKGGGTASAFIGYGVVAAALCALLGGGLLWTRARNGKAERLMQAAGLQQTRDEEGQVRYVWPGLHLPGQPGQPGQPGYAAPGQHPQPYPYPQQQHPQYAQQPHAPQQYQQHHLPYPPPYSPPQGGQQPGPYQQPQQPPYPQHPQQ